MRTILALVIAASFAGLPSFSRAAEADDTGQNVRDRSGSAITPMDQGNGMADLRITQSIRQALLAQDGLSTNAKNVKVITREGVVTLRGPVASPAEKAQIADLARRAAGVSRVDDQLEVERD
ncbi:MAG TPA: BON domain-containing protein [Myxococcota bacterium]|jgi:osmotically-inducible protein OsmY|nr:BON domain-containing protein [Myxococcota bacterium]